MHIRIFVTGGTFDKEYDEINGNLYFKKTHIREMLDLGRSKIDVNISTLMMKDSLEMKNEDRALILDNCLKAKEDKIIITHGTDTMVETAKSLEDIKDKGFIPKYFYSGIDRQPSYKKLIEMYNDKNGKKVSIKVLPRFDNISATKIRKAINKGSVNKYLPYKQLLIKYGEKYNWFS